MHHLHFNHWALLVSALIQWVVGAIWYSLLFNKPWMALTGHTPGVKPKNAVFAMASSFVVSLVLSFFLMHVVYWSGAHDLGFGALVGLICWVGFIAAPLFSQHIFEQRSFKLYWINAGYWLVSMVLSGALLAVWR